MTPSTRSSAPAACSTLVMPPLSTIARSGCARLEPIDAIIIERRDLAIFPRREALQPGLARMHDQRIDARRFHRAASASRAPASGSCSSMPMRHFTVTGNPRPPPSWRRRSRRRAPAPPSDRRRSGPPARGRRAADIEVDLVVAEILGDARAFRERARIAAAKLQRHRMLGRDRRPGAARDRRAAPRRW